jgi:hypothetical protein
VLRDITIQAALSQVFDPVLSTEAVELATPLSVHQEAV